MTETSLADGIIQALLDQGVDTIFGIGGTHTLQLLGAIERSAGITFVPARTELGAAYMAIGYARATLQPAVVLTSTGPGALNVTGVLEDAMWSSTPLLHLTTTIGGSDFAGAVHETPHQNQVFAHVCKSVVEVEPVRVGERIAEAVAVARRSPSGPVTVAVPAGHWADVVVVDAVRTEPEPAVAADIDDIVQDLELSQRPVVFAGGGALHGDRGARVLCLAEHLGAPIVTSYQARTIAPTDHPLYVGPWATELSVKDVFARADVAIVFGSKLSALGTGGWQLPLPERTHRIDLRRGTHPNYPQLRNHRADAGTVARQLLDVVPARDSWIDCAPIRTTVLDHKRTESPNEIAFLEALSKATHGAPLLTADMSKAGFWAMKFLEGAQHAMHAFSGYMAMGSGLPMAIGAAAATGERVLALVGDGALQMSLAELATLADTGLPVTVLVIVDNAYGILRDNCAAVGGSASVGVDLWNPDLAAMSAAFGFDVVDVSDPDQLAHALTGDSKGPQIVLVHQRFSRTW